MRSSALLIVAVVLVASSHGAERPNILLILADDLAWSDPACCGHPWHATPNLDALARDGMRFTSGYAPAPICSASRASILTGKTTARLGFEFVTKNEAGFQRIEGETSLKAPPFTLNLPLEEKTIPEYLNEFGYETAFFGKWHLNAHHGRYLGWSPEFGPRAQGFHTAEEDFGSHPYRWGKRTPEPIKAKGELPQDTMIERAIAFLQQDRKQPFFLMVSLFHVHTPVRTRCQWLIDKYEQKVPRDSPNREQRVTYAAFVEEMDHHVGTLLAVLDEAGLREKTLVVFTSDNGGHPQYTANGPLRGSKWNLFEGGIRVPLIARWPKQIPEETVRSTPVIGYDLLPTFVELAGGAAREVDGVSLVSQLKDPMHALDRSLLWHFPYYHPERGYKDARDEIGINDFAVSKTRPQSALRHGDYKLLYFHEDQSVELYDLANDLGEQKDVSESQRELTGKLKRELQERLREADARMPTRVMK